MVLGKLPVPGRPTIRITLGQGPTALAVGAGGGCLDIFTLIYPFFPLSPSLWETARYRLKYCLKGPLNPKQPTNQQTNLMLYNLSVVRNIRKEDVVIIRLRIGHTRFSHSYLLNREEQPFCIVCNQYITVKHILTDCIDFSEDRNKYFQVTVGWSGGAMVLGKLPVPGRPTIWIQ